jgi:hypothetical protein
MSIDALRELRIWSQGFACGFYTMLAIMSLTKVIAELSK